LVACHCGQYDVTKLFQKLTSRLLLTTQQRWMETVWGKLTPAAKLSRVCFGLFLDACFLKGNLSKHATRSLSRSFIRIMLTDYVFKRTSEIRTQGHANFFLLNCKYLKTFQNIKKKTLPYF